ncbi:MAG: beta-mannosidase [Armatimonadota bacterium]
MQVIELGGQWQVQQVGQQEWLPAQVPGCVHTDLLAAEKIDDPYYRDNEDRLRWIGEAEWVYTRTYTAPAELLQRDRVLLRCEGLDTLATIAINGSEIARTDNMFRTWEFDVKAALVAGENTIEVRFASPLPVMKEKQAERFVNGWSGAKEPQGRAWIRKEPCNFGWDWGPVLITCGIWRSISLVAFDTARLSDVHIRQDHSTPGAVALNVEIAAKVTSPAALSAVIMVTLDGTTVAETRKPVEGVKAQAEINIPNPQLWWPNNMGAQPLYQVTVTLLDAQGSTLDTMTKRIGLRTLRLDRHPDEWGESFQFVVNGVPFFAKGANWIPADAFATHMTRERYADLLHSTAAANMNMLRVWGGGIYEDDAFYELCDELGICLWHDFMFACSCYPAFDEAFMANVQAEAQDNVRRLRHHPCIAMWCGNNELEQGLVGDAWSEHQMSWEDYGKLFDRLLPEVIQALDPERDYWPGSPHTPHGDRKDFNNATCGDAHLWTVWHGRQPFEWYRTCEHRFNSEFGFQSFPEPKTVNGYTEPQDRNVTTYVMEHHQRSGIGNTVIMQYMLDWFRLPTSFESTLWMSQILHGMAMKYAVEHWRRSMPHGMGTLYWQLNDCWPVASWASIDYHGRWKALHYMARRFNTPLMISGVEDRTTGMVEVHITSDLLASREGVATWTLTDVAGAVLAEGQLPVQVAPGKNTLVETLDLSAYLTDPGARNLLLWLELQADGQTVSSDLVLFARPKHLELADPGIQTTIREAEAGSFLVTLTAEQPALWTWLELTDADLRSTDNFLHLRPGVPVEVKITPSVPLTLAEVEGQLRVSSLVDTYALPKVSAEV